LPTPCGLGNSERDGILACPLLSINPTTSKAIWPKCGSSLCLKRTVYMSSIGIMLGVKVEQRVNVKFLVKLGKSATETYSLLMVMNVYLVLKFSSG
jgi:hypothetical protein